MSLQLVTGHSVGRVEDLDDLERTTAQRRQAVIPSTPAGVVDPFGTGSIMDPSAVAAAAVESVNQTVTVGAPDIGIVTIAKGGEDDSNDDDDSDGKGDDSDDDDVWQ